MVPETLQLNPTPCTSTAQLFVLIGRGVLVHWHVSPRARGWTRVRWRVLLLPSCTRAETMQSCAAVRAEGRKTCPHSPSSPSSSMGSRGNRWGGRQGGEGDWWRNKKRRDKEMKSKDKGERRKSGCKQTKWEWWDGLQRKGSKERRCRLTRI